MKVVFVLLAGFAVGAFASKCLDERSSVLGSGRVGAYTPRCDEQGRYHPTQCHGSVCFCVDRIIGQRIKGTEQPISEIDLVERKCSASNSIATPKGCEAEAAEALASGLIGRFVPQCDENGRYHPLQCRESVCYCVERLTGTRIFGTERHISERADAEDFCSASNGVQKRSDRPKSACEEERDDPAKEGLMGAFRPQCEESGAYKVFQCHESVCFCADPMTGKTKGSGKHVSNYDTMEAECMNKMSRCEKKRYDAAQRRAHGQFIAQCDEMGLYEQTQCHGSVCFCVEPLNGAPIKGTEGNIGSISEIKAKCAKPDCQQKHELAAVPGAFKPRCNSQNGYYHPVQCRESSCFCVNRITGEQTSEAVHISQAGQLHDKCMTACEKQNEAPRVGHGDHRKQCDVDGSFHNVQCQESVCACAEKDTGNILYGTEKNIGSYRQLERQCFGGPETCKNTRMAFRWSKCPDTCTYYRGAGEALVQCCCD